MDIIFTAQRQKGEPMRDLISRQMAIDAMISQNGVVDKSVAKRILIQLPSVQQEIIRCRDCKHWDKTWTNDWAPDYHYCPIIDGVRKCDFYCADAEVSE